MRDARSVERGYGRRVGLSHGYLEGVGGVRLFFRVWEVEAPVGRALVIHGLGEHSGRYERLARDLGEAGIEVYALDHRGHGRSGGRRGHVRRLEHMVRDMDRLRRQVSGRSRPLFLLGHSLGGLLVLRHLQLFDPADIGGAVLVAPFLATSERVPTWKAGLAGLGDRMMPGLALDSGLERERLLRDPLERERHRCDPMIHRQISGRLWGEMLRHAAHARREADRLRRPLLLQLPGGDRVVDGRAARELLEGVSAPVEVREYGDAYHDLYHEPEGAVAVTEAREWLLERIAGGRKEDVGD